MANMTPTDEAVVKAFPSDAQNKLAMYNDMRKKGILCDVVFVTKDIGNNRVYAHKLVIFKASTFCASMILKEGNGIKIPLEIKVESISREVVDKIIGYMYTGDISIKLSQVEEIYEASQHFKLKHVQEECVNLLCTNVCAKPATMLQKKPSHVNDPSQAIVCQLWLEVEKRLFDNFAQFIESEEYLEISSNHFKLLMLSFLNREQKPDPTLLCQALGRWAKKDRVQRHPIVVWLVKKFEDNPKAENSLLANIDRIFEAKSASDSKSQKCIDMFEDNSKPTAPVPMDVTTEEEKQKTNGNDNETIQPDVKKRCLVSHNTKSVISPSNLTLQDATMIFVEIQLGENGISQRDLWTFNFKEKRFNKLISMPPSSGTLEQIIVADTMVYVIGGVHNHTVSNQVQVLNLVDSPRQWKPAPSLIVGRKEFATAVYKNFVYVIGGSNIKSAKGALTSVERLDVKTTNGKWKSMSKMEDARVGASASVLNGFIFVVGGRKVKDSKVTWKSVEMYDIALDVWTKISNMWTPRSGCSTISQTDHLLYVFGGENNDGVCNSVEMYDMTKDSWSYVASLKQKRRYSSAVSIGKKIFVFGGYDANSVRINTAEMFDPNTGLWEFYIKPSDSVCVTSSFRTVALIDKSCLL